MILKIAGGDVPICLIDLGEGEVCDNIAAAALAAGVPLMAWSGEIGRMLGPPPSPGLMPAFAYAMEHRQVRARGLAHTGALSLTNASSKLNQLWAGGYLMRGKVGQASGGMEYLYARLG